MTRYAPLALLPGETVPVPYTPTRTPPKPGILTRFFRALIEARQHQAERAVARYLASSGGKLTDSIEREIERRLV